MRATERKMENFCIKKTLDRKKKLEKERNNKEEERRSEREGDLKKII
jgi:hypothetical protein